MSGLHGYSSAEMVNMRFVMLPGTAAGGLAQSRTPAIQSLQGPTETLAHASPAPTAHLTAMPSPGALTTPQQVGCCQMPHVALPGVILSESQVPSPDCAVAC